MLQLFLGNPNRSFYVREITRKIDEQINSVRRELANLLSIGIISSEETGHRLYYEVDQKYEYFDALSAIFGSKKKAVATTVKENNDETSAITAIGNVELALLTGQFTRDESVEIDLLIVGDVNQTKLNRFIDELETKEGKEVRYTVMSLKEFNYRLQIKDRFVNVVLAAKKQVLIDKHKLLDKQ